jgi:hypothetical protein
MTAHRLTQLTLTAIIFDAWVLLAMRAVWHSLRGML